MKSSILLLGTGASLGVPVVSCDCEVCKSRTPYNRRSRTSALLKVGLKRFLIDAGTDLREQALQHHITHIDGVLFTHAHQDHVGGIDDLRVYHFTKQASLPCLSSRSTYEDILHRFPFMLKHHAHEALGARLEFQVLAEDAGTIHFQGVRMDYFTYLQQETKVTGFRFGSMAYVTDIKSYTPEILSQLAGVDLLIVSALRMRPSDMHFTLDEACDFSRSVGAKETFLTHLSHEIDYFKGSSYLPKGIRLGFDGQELEFSAYD